MKLIMKLIMKFSCSTEMAFVGGTFPDFFFSFLQNAIVIFSIVIANMRHV